MVEQWALDASPLIVLARIGLEDLPLSLTAQVVVPRPVAEEIQAGPAQDPARQALTAGRFIIVDTPSPLPSCWLGTLDMARRLSFRGPSRKRGGQPF